MKTYSFVFVGRLKNALGVPYRISASVEACTYNEAVLKLYDTYEHIMILSHTVTE